MISADDLSVLRLFVLIRASNERVSQETLLAEVERRKIRGLTATALRGLLSSLVRRRLIRPVKGDLPAFEATRQGRQVAKEARGRLAAWMTLIDD